MSEQSQFFACIMAGGSGERFWPMSRAQTPKHLLKLLSDRTLVEETVRRHGCGGAGGEYFCAHQ
jgi:mannose-1-phosphate guanylyltransferase